MAISASAPGKLVLAGDYAVLDGAPAVVLALARRAHAHLLPGLRRGIELEAPEIGAHTLAGSWRDGQVQWQDVPEAARGRLHLVTALLERQARHGLLPPALRIRLDTREFFAADGGKLGLGSSAALTVALAAALAEAAGEAPPTLAELVDVHRDMQAGRGSGLDIAASLHGGVVLYQLRDGCPEVRPLAWPDHLGLCAVWSGHSASTAAALSRLAQWRSALGGVARQVMGGLRATALAVANAMEAGRIADIIDGLGAYAERLVRLGEASGIDIVTAEHRRLASLAQRCGLVYKTCGAGGGDIGVALGTDADALASFARRAGEQGFLVVNADIDPQGLDTSPAREEQGEGRE